MQRRGRVAIASGSAGLAVLLAVGACQNYGNQKMADGSPEVPDKISYNFDVRPVLSQNCFGCHGSGTQKAGLRLDDQKTATSDLPENKGRRAIVPGNPKRSEIIKRITSTDPEFRMPPREAHKTLSPYEVALLTKWVKQGAKYEQHWAYTAPKEISPARTEWDKKAVNRIDNYIYNGLQKAKLHPSPEADKETLINRVTLDLTGLPPTLAEVDAFLADTSPNAYEKLVDRLLASDAYAERMTQGWMDVARYGDTDGYLNDPDGRFQYPYRDWVISAFKRNIPYDRFVTWQLAGDKLPNPTREQILATAFTRLNAKSNEMGLIDEEYRVTYVNERAELVGKAFLGLTVGCAKCHDHKYDVISQADYYSMGGFFNQIDEQGMAGNGPTLDWPTAMQAARLGKVKAEAAAKEAVYRAAYARALKGAEGRAAELVRSGQGATLLQATLDGAQQAYYPFENYFKASFEPLMIEPAVRRNGGRYAGLMAKATVPLAPGVKLPDATTRPAASTSTAPKPGVKRIAIKGEKPATAPARLPMRDPGLQRLAKDDLDTAVGNHLARGKVLSITDNSIFQKQLFVGLKESALFWTKAGVDGAKPGVVNNGHTIQGPPGKGQAVMLDDTMAFADSEVGKFERTQAYSFDLWVKLRADKPYEAVDILFNGSAYAVSLENNRLVWSIVASAPYNQINVRAKSELPKGRWVHIAATYNGSSRASGLKLYADGKPVEVQVLHDNLTGSAFPRGGHNNYGSYTGLSMGRAFGVPEFQKGAVDELRVFTRALTPSEVAYLHDKRSVAPDRAPADLAAILASKDPAVAKAEADWKAAVLAELQAQRPIKSIDVLKDAMTLRPTYLLTRGNYDQHGKEVPVQALPRVFAYDAKKYPANRLGLTQWMFDPKHPLTARVYVNRLWQSHFGTGIVETVEDFGTQGSNPTNLPLLDYLAIEFQRSGWDIRHMQKLMVMSATYRQSSNIPRDLLEKDNRNFLLARGPRYRLSAEMIRDNALFAAGLLDKSIGGDAVFPYQPDGVWQNIGTGPNVYPTDVPADQMHRRTLYTYVKRNALFPSMQVFDVQDRNVSSVSRRISNTPLQALVLLNDPQYMEAYRKLAERAMKLHPSDPDQQVVTLFRLATRRRPQARELGEMTRYRTAQAVRLAATPEEVKKLVSIGVAGRDPSLDETQLAAMTLVAAGVMNTPDAYSLR